MGARGRAVLLSDGGSLSLTAEEPGLECKAFFTRVIGAEHLRIHEHLPSIGAKWYVSMYMCAMCNSKGSLFGLWHSIQISSGA